MAVDHDGISRLLARRQAALATQTADGPAISYVRYAIAAPAQLLLFVSRLAAHTQQMAADRRVALLVIAADTQQHDAQQRARLSLQATAEPVGTDDQADAQQCYLMQLPTQALLFGLGDFQMMRLTVRQARYVGGFAQAYDLHTAEIAAIWQQAARLSDGSTA